MSASLLERQSTGGAIARVGFEYQDAYVLLNLPKWLAQGAFSLVVSEAVGDVEVCYFGAEGQQRVMYEAKDCSLPSTKFWAEINRFQEVRQAADEYRRFVLVCNGYSSELAPLLAQLKRLRGVGSSFEASSPLVLQDRQAVIDWVTGKGRSVAEAEFVLDFVDFEEFSAASADAAFGGMLGQHFPTLDLRQKQINAFREKCKALVSRSSFGPIQRADIEAALVEEMEEDAADWLRQPTTVQLMDGPVPLGMLGVDLGCFNGPGRGGLSAADWEGLQGSLSGVASFIKSSRARRCIYLDGKQRMSLACSLGFTFGAAPGFVLQIEHNGSVYRTDQHDKASGPFFSTSEMTGEFGAQEGVAFIGFPTPVGSDSAAIEDGSLEGAPQLMLEGSAAIDGIAALNTAVAEAKAALSRFKSTHRLSKIHLVIKAPSLFAMALGHRLNSLGHIQLYDWVDGGYRPSALIQAG